MKGLWVGEWGRDRGRGERGFWVVEGRPGGIGDGTIHAGRGRGSGRRGEAGKENRGQTWGIKRNTSMGQGRGITERERGKGKGNGRPEGERDRLDKVGIFNGNVNIAG